MRAREFQKLAVGVLALATVFAGLSLSPALADSPTPPPDQGKATVQDHVPSAQRKALVGDGGGSDVSVTTIGDASGITVLTSDAASGYQWRAIATLSVDGLSTDRWISNSCLTSDGSKLVVVYGTRAMVNKEQLFDAGGWASIVDVKSGNVTDLGRGYSMSYFDPGCGSGNNVALTAYQDGKTLLGVLDAGRSEAVYQVSSPGELTSAIPDAKGDLFAAGPGGIVSIHRDGSTSLRAKTSGPAYGLTMGANDQLAFLQYKGRTAHAQKLDLTSSNSKPMDVAVGLLTSTGLSRDAQGKVYVLGDSSVKSADPSVGVLHAATHSEVSSSGRLVVEASQSLDPTAVINGAEDSHFQIDAFAPATGKRLSFNFPSKQAMSKHAAGGSQVQRGSVSSIPSAGIVRTASLMSPMGSPTNPVESERACAIARNDPANQVLQPKPRQVEWAVDMAILGHLTTTSATNLTNLGSPGFSPQGMFPLPSLTGGGHIPAQVVLGILAQESNLWQADSYTSPGQLGNPLIGDFYGTNHVSETDPAFWTIKFTGADCGYGVGQITDGMRLAGHDSASDPALPAAQQRAIAVDYAANIARVLQVLAGKWNALKAAGVQINDGAASGLENWFAAIWAYNSGIQPTAQFGNTTGCTPGPTCVGVDGTWGLGWTNNPIRYDPSRLPFLQDNHFVDAANPQRWPYPEKVLGFAAWPITLNESVYVNSASHPTSYTPNPVGAFRAAWWTSDGNRQKVKPPIDLFCTTTNNHCDPSSSNKCLLMDSQCWWHAPVVWKSCTVRAECGNEVIRFTYPTYAAAQPDGDSLPPNCSTSALPSGSLVVDDVPPTQVPLRSDCTRQTSGGSFAFQFFSPDANGSYPGKIDLHQQGGGFNGHFYFTHVRNVSAGDKTEISGTWSLGQSLAQWTRVFVHVPSYAAWSPQASYKISLGDGTSETRTVNQRRFANEWVQLGVFHMNGVPAVTLTNIANYADGFDDIAWDSVAFQPLSAKPASFVVSMGDSFSSGEGATTDLSSGAGYTSESDHDGTDTSPTNSLRDGCHRSTQAWSRKATLPGATSTIGAQSDSFASTLDYHLIACAGAVASNLQSGQHGQYGELDQVDQGYLDANTTLVTVSIGGNDMRFSDIVQACVYANAADIAANDYVPCNQGSLSGDGTSTIQDATSNRLANVLPGLLAADLAQIHAKAPNAKVVLMGYPELFESASSCVFINDQDRPWLNSVSAGLRDAMSAAATTAASTGIAVKFEDPQPFFTGHNLCTSTPAENPLVFTLTPGDKPMFTVPVPGPNFGLGVSQQSVHPNTLGTTYYASALQDALSGFYP